MDGNNVLNPFVNPKVSDYGKAGYDRTHTLVIKFDLHDAEAQHPVEQPGQPDCLG